MQPLVIIYELKCQVKNRIFLSVEKTKWIIYSDIFQGLVFIFYTENVL